MSAMLEQRIMSAVEALRPRLNYLGFTIDAVTDAALDANFEANEDTGMGDEAGELVVTVRRSSEPSKDFAQLRESDFAKEERKIADSHGEDNIGLYAGKAFERMIRAATASQCFLHKLDDIATELID